jgi:ubiquinone/menaquinone biosynthesis C-methylase UbiE
MYDGKLIQNVEKLSFFSESFDVVTSTEVFEHVANDLDGFREVFRVLKTNGKFIFTVPLELNAKTVTRAILKSGGVIEHILEPEYHGDYLRNGILAFRNYGVDIIDTLKSVGFTEVIIYNVQSQFKKMKPVISCVK